MQAIYKDGSRGLEYIVPPAVLQRAERAKLFEDGMICPASREII